jgi:hypothetical protein
VGYRVIKGSRDSAGFKVVKVGRAAKVSVDGRGVRVGRASRE